MKELVCIKPFTQIADDFKLPPPKVGEPYTATGIFKKGYITLKEYGPNWGFDETKFVPRNPLLADLLKDGVEEKLDIKKQGVCVGEI